MEGAGLISALIELAESTTNDTGVQCEFVCDEPVRFEDNELSTHLYRIAQEAVTNALKHGAARHVTISLVNDGAEIVLTVRDDGKGISAGRHAVAPALLRSKAGWFHRPLDVAAMQDAASLLPGERDFSAFRDAQCQARSPVRILHEARVERIGPLVVFTLRANALLHHMVRNVVGSLVYVGAGRQPAAWIGQLLAGRDRRRATPAFATRRPVPLGHRV